MSEYELASVMAGVGPGTIIVECSHGHRWEMPTGWRIDGVTAIVCRDGEDVLAAAGFVFQDGGALTLDTIGWNPAAAERIGRA